MLFLVDDIHYNSKQHINFHWYEMSDRPCLSSALTVLHCVVDHLLPLLATYEKNTHEMTVRTQNTWT